MKRLYSFLVLMLSVTGVSAQLKYSQGNGYWDVSIPDGYYLGIADKGSSPEDAVASAVLSMLLDKHVDCLAQTMTQKSPDGNTQGSARFTYDGFVNYKTQFITSLQSGEVIAVIAPDANTKDSVLVGIERVYRKGLKNGKPTVEDYSLECMIAIGGKLGEEWYYKIEDDMIYKSHHTGDCANISKQPINKLNYATSPFTDKAQITYQYKMGATKRNDISQRNENMSVAWLQMQCELLFENIIVEKNASKIIPTTKRQPTPIRKLGYRNGHFSIMVDGLK